MPARVFDQIRTIPVAHFFGYNAKSSQIGPAVFRTFSITVHSSLNHDQVEVADTLSDVGVDVELGDAEHECIWVVLQKCWFFYMPGIYATDIVVYEYSLFIGVDLG